MRKRVTTLKNIKGKRIRIIDKKIKNQDRSNKKIIKSLTFKIRKNGVIKKYLWIKFCRGLK